MYSVSTRTFGLRHLERLGQPFARSVHGLGRGPHRQLVAFPLADAAVGLEAGVRLHLRRVRAFDDMRRGLEAGGEIAPRRGALGEVALREHGRRFGRIACSMVARCGRTL